MAEFVEVQIGDQWMNLWKFGYRIYGRTCGGSDKGFMDEFVEVQIRDLWTNLWRFRYGITYFTNLWRSI